VARYLSCSCQVTTSNENDGFAIALERFILP
jgi:hypothetical protein